MEEARRASYNVTQPYDMTRQLELAGAIFFSNADAAPDKSLLNAYLLGTSNARMIVDPLKLREAWAKACYYATLGHTTNRGKFPLLRVGEDALVSSRYPAVWRAGNVRMRLSFDFDGVPGCEELPFPTAQELFDRVCEFLQTNTMYDDADPPPYRQEACTVFLGSNNVKNRSAHVIFHDLCFGDADHNKLKNGDPLCEAMTEHIGMGLQADLGIQGIKWEFMDKKDKGQWRGAVLPIAQHFNVHPSKVEFWEGLADRIDPHVLRGDEAWENVINWKRREKRARVVGDYPNPFENDINPVERRVREFFPDFFPPNIIFEDKGNNCFVPNTRLCPLRQGEHSRAGKFYVCGTSDGLITCACHSSNCTAINIPRLYVEPFPDLIAAFERVYCRVGKMALLRASLHPPMKTLLMLTRTGVRDHVASIPLNQGGDLKIGKQVVKRSDYWFDNAKETYVQLAFMPPPQVCPAIFFNTFTGFNPPVVVAADSFRDLTHEELLRKLPTMLTHMYTNVCDSDRDVYMQLLGFFSHMLRFPGIKPKWALWMYGPQGQGKGLLMAFIALILGPRNYFHADPKSISEEFNGDIMEKILIYSDEGIDAVGNNAATANKMVKKLVTETSQTVRRKFQDNYNIDTCFRLVASSNDDPCMDAGDRRWLVLYCDTRTKNDNGDIALPIAQLVAESESVESAGAFLEMARRGYYVEGFQFEEAPTSKYKTALVEEGFTGMQKFWVTLLKEEDETIFTTVRKSKHEFYELFRASLPEREKLNKENTDVKFWNYCVKVVPKDDWNMKRSRLNGAMNAVATYVMPPIEDLRAGLAHLLKLPRDYFAVQQVQE